MRLRYHSLEPINVDWPELQNLFRQRYSKVGNTREQLFHAWRSFNFDENTEIIDAYVTQIRHVATLLGYWELQILEVFKNTLPTKLFWILFPIEGLKQVVEMAKRILTKEKLDKQLTGQTSASPFMSIRQGTNRKVSFDTIDELGDKIDKLTVMLARLAAMDNHDKRPFKPQIYQGRERGHNRNFNQRNYQDRNRLKNRSNIRDRGQFRVMPRSEQNYRGSNFEAILGDVVDRMAEGNIEIMPMDIMITLEVRIGQGKGYSQGITVATKLEV